MDVAVFDRSEIIEQAFGCKRSGIGNSGADSVVFVKTAFHILAEHCDIIFALFRETADDIDAVLFFDKSVSFVESIVYGLIEKFFGIDFAIREGIGVFSEGKNVYLFAAPVFCFVKEAGGFSIDRNIGFGFIFAVIAGSEHESAGKHKHAKKNTADSFEHNTPLNNFFKIIYFIPNRIISQGIYGNFLLY